MLVGYRYDAALSAVVTSPRLSLICSGEALVPLVAQRPTWYDRCYSSTEGWLFMVRAPRILVAVAAVVGAITVATPASADDDPPSPGSPCSSNQLNETAKTNDGTTVRCLANEENGFIWIADTGAAAKIAQLQSEGYTVTITRIGTGPLDLCKVTDVLIRVR